MVPASPPDTLQSYTWQGYRCTYDRAPGLGESAVALVTMHPVGVGLSRRFWHRFSRQWPAQGGTAPVYNPDLLGCGGSDRPRVAYYPEDWADQLYHFITTVVQRPVVLLVQGALATTALLMVDRPDSDRWIRGLVLAGPPGWPLLTQSVPALQPRLLWNGFFGTAIGNAFFRYARRPAFLSSFSERQLFADPEAIDQEWLDLLAQGADLDNRYAVFSFLAGFWRRDYTALVEAVQQPTLVLFGQAASGIDRISRPDDAQQRLRDYLSHLPQGTGQLIPGRNVLPYESTAAFIGALQDWWPQVTG